NPGGRPNFGGGGVGRGGGRGRGGMGGGGMGRGGMGGGFPRFPQQQRPQNPQRRGRIESENEGAEEFLQKLSETTAGRFYESKASKFKDTFALIVDELRHQYRLGYYPPEETASAAVHDLKVKVARPNLVVRARSSYRSMTN